MREPVIVPTGKSNAIHDDRPLKAAPEPSSPLMVSLTIASVGDITKAQKTDERPLKTGLGPHVGIRREFDLTATEQNPGGHFGPVRQNSLRMIVTKVRPRRVT